MYSKIILEEFPKSTGIGVSLPVEKGGVKFEIENKNYKIFYKDILEKEYRLELPKKLDFAISSCVSYVKSKNSFLLNIELILKSLNLILSNLDTDGNLIINMTMKNINLCYNMINILEKYFKSYKLWKSESVWNTKNTFYFFGYNFKNEKYDNELLKVIEQVKNQNDIMFNFLGNEKEYKDISKNIQELYILRINAWLKNIHKNSINN